MTVDEWDSLSTKVRDLGQKYFEAGMNGSIPQELQDAMWKANDEFNAACRNYLDMLRSH